VVEAEIANRGAVAGEETVLLFVHDPVASLARPDLELKGMAKAHLAAGESTKIRITLAADDLAFLGHDLKPVLEPGKLEFLVGPSADRSSLATTSIHVRER